MIWNSKGERSLTLQEQQISRLLCTKIRKVEIGVIEVRHFNSDDEDKSKIYTNFIIC